LPLPPGLALRPACPTQNGAQRFEPQDPAYPSKVGAHISQGAAKYRNLLSIRRPKDDLTRARHTAFLNVLRHHFFKPYATTC
jgi:hypothetical protein